jgi:hypothetical protein
MWRKRLIAALLIVIVVGAGYLAWSFTHPPVSDEEQVNRLLDRIEQGVETKSPRMILSTIADDYRDAYGYTRLDIHRLSLNLLRTTGRPQVNLDRVDIRVHGDEADVGVHGEVTLIEAGQESQEFSGSLTVQLRKRGGRWQIVSTAGWQTEAGGGFEE